LPLEVLESKIQEIQKLSNIEMVDLYGGEVGLLPESYMNDLCILLRKYNIDDINIITNLSMINNVILNPDFYVTVSYDFECREQHSRVWNNMFLLTKDFSILILAGPDLIKKDVDEMITQLNMLSHLSSVEIKPYSTNQSNCFNLTHIDFEVFVKKWISSPIEKKFTFVNEDNIQRSLSGRKNAFSNDHVYITPSGNFAVLEFDLNDREFFKELETFEQYLKWAEQEPVKNVSTICKSCEYYGKCLTEHYRFVKNLDNSCNGYKFLLDWYRTK
jgi:sulfatase maturation enzyme AslB (radical SAM superfamily)